MKNTIKNLDKVLGISTPEPIPVQQNQLPIQVEKTQLPKPIQPVQKTQLNNANFKFARYVEIINGRCAMAGRIVSPIIIDTTVKGNIVDNNKLFEFLTNDTIIAIGSFYILTGIIGILTTLTFEKLDPDETIELNLGRFFMIDWLYILGYFFYLLFI